MTLRVLIAAPGTLVGTYDIFRYWSTALSRASGVDELEEFRFHERIAWHQERSAARAGSPGVGLLLAVESASGELLDTCASWRPDVLLVVDGLAYSAAIWPKLSKLSRDNAKPFALACLFTEAPYFELAAEQLGRWFQLLFCTERASVPRLRSKLPHTRVEYLPHCYSRDVHRPAAASAPRYDVYSCCTFFPERIRLLRQIDWSPYRACFPGQWMMATAEDRRALAPWIEDSTRTNAMVARDYRESRLVLNIHRSGSTHALQGDPMTRLQEFPFVPSAESMGPRPLEAAACRAFQLSDARDELVETFGDFVPVFRDARELADLVSRFLGPCESERLDMARRAHDCVRGMSYDDRAPRLVRSLSAICEASRGRS